MKRFLQYIAEEWFDTRRSGLNRDIVYEIFKNPTARETQDLDPKKEGVRGIIKGADILLWPVYADLHAKIKTVYKWTMAESILIFRMGGEKWVTLSTDYDRGYPYKELVVVKKNLESHKNLRKAMGGDFTVYKSGKVPIK